MKLFLDEAASGDVRIQLDMDIMMTMEEFETQTAGYMTHGFGELSRYFEKTLKPIFENEGIKILRVKAKRTA
jgi:hypothetical protein